MIKLSNSKQFKVVVLGIVCLLKSQTALTKQYLGYCLEDSFDNGMIGLEEEIVAYQDFLANTPDAAILNLIKDNYHEFVRDIEGLYTTAPKIPKIIHQIWVGPHQFPKEAREWQQSWQRLHLDWEYHLWTNEDVKKLNFANKKYYNEAKNWGEKADILRYEILYRFGGLYVDVDGACIKSFDFLHHTCDFYTAIHALPLMTFHKNKFRIANGVFASAPGHPILKHAVEQIKKNRHHSHLIHRTGPDFFTKMILEKLDSSRDQGNVDVVLPANYLYPSGKRLEKEFNIKPNAPIYIKPETLAVHYYTSYWNTPPKP